MVDTALEATAPTDSTKFVHTPRLMNEELIQEILADFDEVVLNR